MRGRRPRLRVAPVGELRRRWAGVLASEEETEGKQKQTFPLEISCVDENSSGVDVCDDVVWETTPAKFLLNNGDPLEGLRPPGSSSQFWGSGDVTPNETISTPKSISTASLVRFAKTEGFSREEIEAVSAVVDNPVEWELAMADSTPVALDRPVTLARKVISILKKNSTKGSAWHGPLPQKRVSPQMTLGDCPIKLVSRPKSGEKQQRPKVRDGVRILNDVSAADPDFSCGQVGGVSEDTTDAEPVLPLGQRQIGVWLKDGPSWIHVQLGSAVGRLLSRKGTLPAVYRNNPGAGGSETLTGRPSYAEIVMAGNGAGGFNNQQHQGGFPNHAGGGFQGPAGSFQGQAAGGFVPHGGFNGDARGPFAHGPGWGGGPQGASGNTMQGSGQWMQPGVGFQQQGFGMQQQFPCQNSGNGIPQQQQQPFFAENSSHNHDQRPPREFNPGYGPGRGGQRHRGRGRDRGRGRNQYGYGGRGNAGGALAGREGRQQPRTPQQQVPAVIQPQQPSAMGHVQQQVPNPANNAATKVAGSTHLQEGGSTAAGSDGIHNETHKSEVQQREGKEVEVEGSLVGEKRKKKKGKGKPEDAWCFRCCSKGHVSAECSTPLFCDICESEEHVAAKCPLKKKPRPVAVAVGYAVDDLGFYHIPHGPIHVSKTDSNTVLIKVEGGSLKEEELISHLRRLFSAKFEWDVQLHAPNMWVTPFPSKTELTRAINFGSADLKNGMWLSFERFEEEQEYFGHELPTIWMRTVNLPKVLRTYEVLWAIGTMFGATVKVDMVTTRKSKFGRFKVAVLNPTMVPNKMDCVIGTRFFELRFAIEPFASDLGGAEVKKKDGHDGDDNGNLDADTDMDDVNKNSKQRDPTSSNSEGTKKHNSQQDGGLEEDGTMEDFDEDDLLDDVGDESFQLRADILATGGKTVQNKLMSNVKETKLERAAPKIILEHEPDMMIGGNSVLAEDSVAVLQGREGSAEAVSMGVEAIPITDGLDLDLSPGKKSDSTHMQPSLALGPLLERALMGLKDAGGEVTCSEASDMAGGDVGFMTPCSTMCTDINGTPLRRSKRRAASVDEDSINRAARLVAKRNLELDEGHLQRDTLDPFLGVVAEGGRASPSYFGVSCA
ncbi:unnamed protein product [Urochloa decumbens]|uniref:CCHC-type domain-containing protein n=1 Tax=Urochloa decumbens TaxID=240449 RepID=A0ABC9ELY7_9POAL